MFREETPPCDAVPRAPRAGNPASSHQLDVEVLTSPDACQDIAGDWRALSTVGAPRNPFADPAWMLTWAQHFVEPGCLRIVVVRENETVVGIAPFHVRRLRVAGITIGRRLELLAGSHDAVLLERPQLITTPGSERRVLRRIAEAAVELDWDFATVLLQAGDGWIEPHWVDDTVYVVPNTVRASVALALPDSAADLQASMKRNLRESIRRARNRLGRAAPGWEIEVADESDFGDALEDLVRLHRSRAGMKGKVLHPDVFQDARHAAFARDVLARAAREHSCELSFLRANGERVGGIAMLRAADGVYFAFSGIHEQWWDFSIVTLLQCEALKRAIDTGVRYADLSVGVDVAKLRWSEQILLHPEFVLVRRRRRSEIVAIPYLLASAGARVRRERNRHARRTA